MAGPVLRLVEPQGVEVPQCWEAAVAGWLTWLKIGGAARATIRLRRDHVRSIARRSGTRRPGELTLTGLVELFGQRDWSNEHRKGVRTSLISFGDWCVAEGLMDANAAAGLPRVHGDRPHPRPAPDEVWRDLLAAAAPREQLMARLAGEAGLRRAEVAACRREDLVPDAGGWALIVAGKGGRQRVVPVTDTLAAAIRSWCVRGFLFPGQVDGHMSPGWVGTIISRLMPPEYSMHKLRHRFATRGYAGTHDLRAVQEALGHASVATTERYTAVTRAEVRAMVEAAGFPDDAA